MSIAIFLGVCLLLGFPIYLCLGLTALVFFHFGDLPLQFVVKSWYSGVDQYALLAVSGFLLVGYLFEESGITEDLIGAVRKLMGAFRAGLAVVTIIGCTFFAAIIGSGPATVATVGGIMIPAMVRAGYTRPAAGAVASSGGALGILIPPSNPFLIYGIVAGLSIGDLFAAGLVPGLIMAVALSITSAFVVKQRWATTNVPDPHFVATSTDLEDADNVAAASFWQARWAIVAMVMLLGGIYSGLFTPIEAAEVTIVYTLVVGFLIKRTLTFTRLWSALRRTLLMSGTLVLLVASAEGFGRLLTIMNVPQEIAGAILGISTEPMVVLLLILGLLIFIGTWAETFSMIIVLTPILLPVVTRLGIDPIHFGVLFVVVAEIGFLTPPFGANLFVSMKIAKVKLEQISIAVLPYVATYILVLVLLAFFPVISLWLPGLLFD